MPCNSFLVTLKSISEEILKNVLGRLPEKWFSPRSKNMRLLFSPPKPSGIVPSSSFLVKYISCRDERLPRDYGITPVKLFFLRFMTLSGKPPSQARISPVKKFESSSILSRLVQFFNWVVISPCSMLLDKLKCCN